jgi:signal transduction histidine kinase
MNPLISLSVLYFFVTVGSASILYFSFKEQIDTSGRFFLLAEVITLPMVVLFALINTNADYQQPVIFFFSNLMGLCAEVAILFSIHALTRAVRIEKFVMLLTLCAAYCLFMEFCRIVIDPNLPTLLYAIVSCGLALSTYAAYKSSAGIEISKNLFLKWIGAIEIGLTLFALTRIASYFLGAPIKPHGPTTLIASFYAFYVGLCIFRYVAYQSLRISWMDPRTHKANILNRDLARAIEEKDQLLRGLIASNRVIGISSLASSLAHQLSQPLTGIALQTETVKRNLLESGQNPSFVIPLNKISDQLGKLSDLVNNLRQLFTSRNDEFHPINLQQITHEILEIIEPTLKAKRIALLKSISSNPVVYGDKIQLQQVLINLFNNATDSITESESTLKEIRLAISQDTEFAKLSIEDSGTGINPALLPTLFDLYNTTKKEGLGVGLWLSKTILDKHQGGITASNGIYGGAIFEIKIPLAREGIIHS